MKYAKKSSFKNIMKIVTSKIVIFARDIKLANIHHYLLQIDLTHECLISKPTSTPPTLMYAALDL